MLAVVVQKAVVQRIDAPEIFVVEHVLTPDVRTRLGVEITLQTGDHRVQDRYVRDGDPRAGVLELAAESPVGQGEENDARLALDLGEDAFELLPGADQGIDVLDRMVVGVIGSGSPRHHVQRLSGGVGDEMHMEDVAASAVHSGFPQSCG